MSSDFRGRPCRRELRLRDQALESARDLAEAVIDFNHLPGGDRTSNTVPSLVSAAATNDEAEGFFESFRPDFFK
jgi:hypothetical protein